MGRGPDPNNSTLSPDGTKLAGLNYSGGQNIAVYDLLARKTINVTKNDFDHSAKGNGWSNFPVWSPDGTEIAHMFSEWNGKGYELRVTSLEGKSRTLLKSEPDDEGLFPRHWSQDGSNILTFTQDSSGSYTVGLVPSEGGSFKAIYKPQWESQFVYGDASRASLSPDGKFIVIADGPENKMDVLIASVDNRTTTVLSDHPSNEYTVVWSPDGKHIAFIRETQGGSLLYALEMAEGKPVGQPFLIKEGMQKVDLNNWTEHGICYNLWIDLFDIYTLPLEMEKGIPAGKPKTLDYTPTGSNNCAVWSHDGKNLAFISFADLPKVVILPVDGGEPSNYNIPVPGLWAQGVYDLSWLPDDSGVGFSWGMGQSTTVYHVDLVTGEWQNWLPDDNSDQWATRIDWGPDNNSFVYTKWNDDVSKENIPDPGLHQFNIKTGETQLIYQPEADSGNIFRMMKFSGDYKKLVTKFDNNNLVVLDLGSAKSHVLTNKYSMPHPTFSPNGEKVLTLGAKNDVTIYSLEGNVLEQYSLSKYLVSGTYCYLPNWSPDGKQLVFQTRKMERKTYIIRNVLK